MDAPDERSACGKNGSCVQYHSTEPGRPVQLSRIPNTGTADHRNSGTGCRAGCDWRPRKSDAASRRNIPDAADQRGLKQFLHRTRSASFAGQALHRTGQRTVAYTPRRGAWVRLLEERFCRRSEDRWETDSAAARQGPRRTSRGMGSTSSVVSRHRSRRKPRPLDAGGNLGGYHRSGATYFAPVSLVQCDWASCSSSDGGAGQRAGGDDCRRSCRCRPSQQSRPWCACCFRFQLPHEPGGDQRNAALCHRGRSGAVGDCECCAPAAGASSHPRS